MKTVILFLFGLCVAFNSFSQRRDNSFIWPINDYTEKFEFSQSVYTPDIKDDSLYSAAKRFIHSVYKGNRDSILVENDTTRTLVYRGAYFMQVDELGDRGKGYVGYTLSISCRYNSYRYKITDLVHYPLNADCVYGGPLENDKAACGGVLFPLRYWNEQKAKCYYMVQTTIERLKETMNKNTEE